MYDKPEFPESWTLNHLFDAAHEVLTTSWDGRAGAIAGEHDGVDVTVAVRKTKKRDLQSSLCFPDDKANWIHGRIALQSSRAWYARARYI